MIRTILRKLKRFMLRHAGIVALTESQATARAEVSILASALDEVKSSVAAIKAGFAELHAPLDKGQATLVEVKAMLAELPGSLGEVKHAVLNEVKFSLNHEVKCTFDPMKALLAELTGSLDEVKAVLGGVRAAQVTAAQVQAQTLKEHAELLRQLTEQAALLSAGLQRSHEEQVGNRLAIDNRLATMNAQLVHVEAFSQILSQLETAFNRLSSSTTSLGVDKWKIQEYEGLLRYSRKQEYLQAIASEKLRVPRVETNHPMAAESNDTRFPRGAKNDNSICLRFNRKLYTLLGERPHLRVLDLGCAGGGFVRSLLDDGHFAVGLDGCPYPKVNQAGEWATIPHHLHTCDITQPFALRDAATGQPLQFDAITAWELLEHIPEESLPTLFANIDKHLAPGGYLLFSVATFVDKDDAIGVVWHVTVKPRAWWVARFREAGFLVDEQQVLDKDDWLRGSGNCRWDWHEDDNLGFHLVLRRPEAVAQAAA